jgi:hypothetical protein
MQHDMSEDNILLLSREQVISYLTHVENIKYRIITCLILPCQTRMASMIMSMKQDCFIYYVLEVIFVCF